MAKLLSQAALLPSTRISLRMSSIPADVLVLDRFVRDLTQRYGDAERRSTPGKPHGLVWVGSHHPAPACGGLCRAAGSEERAFHLHKVDIAGVSDSGVRHRCLDGPRRFDGLGAPADVLRREQAGEGNTNSE